MISVTFDKIINMSLLNKSMYVFLKKNYTCRHVLCNVSIKSKTVIQGD